jgi:hypothetical protein
VSALFDQPVRGKDSSGKQVLILGVVDDSYAAGEFTRADPKLLVNLGNGMLTLADIGEIRTLWKYGVVPTGSRQGDLGWYDDIPEEEESVNPIDVDDDGG